MPAQFQTAEAAAVTAVQDAAAEAEAEGEMLEGQQAGDIAIDALQQTVESLEQQQVSGAPVPKLPKTTKQAEGAVVESHPGVVYGAAAITRARGVFPSPK